MAICKEEEEEEQFRKAKNEIGLLLVRQQSGITKAIAASESNSICRMGKQDVDGYVDVAIVELVELLGPW
uniref:HDC12758 n=1 Tax=Drosophila melanogaster TaxID=7227 RepID=Q6IKD9_DROME|nr:TPA_inf: HDC12758 [Drosophila melanogaster]